ncbi:putative transcription factor WRKY family [Helianthus annuus]|uniref:Putative WRKY domain-containing protein n=1 Tax=Helianthus annuus TaxID=4232 RepID=A0A251SNB5_HELAN|nr:putative transcription factor WRKY family [Helianthus annuus]
MDDAWDLHAVVRSCTAMNAAAVNAITAEDYDDVCYSPESLASGCESNPFAFSTPGNVSGGLEDVYKAGCGLPLPTSGETTSTIATCIDGEGFCHEQLTDSHDSFSMSSQSTRPRKRKNQEKRVFQLTQEQLSNDLWAWRKYGQKPIKGSPFPRYIFCFFFELRGIFFVI